VSKGKSFKNLKITTSRGVSKVTPCRKIYNLKGGKERSIRNILKENEAWGKPKGIDETKKSSLEQSSRTNQGTPEQAVLYIQGGRNAEKVSGTVIINYMSDMMHKLNGYL
jgi:hypothetical protein